MQAAFFCVFAYKIRRNTSSRLRFPSVTYAPGFLLCLYFTTAKAKCQYPKTISFLGKFYNTLMYIFRGCQIYFSERGKKSEKTIDRGAYLW